MDRKGTGRQGVFFSSDLRIGGFLLMFGLLALSIAAFLFFRFFDLNEQQRRASLREKVFIARHVLQPVVDELHAGLLDMNQARQVARRSMESLVYEDAFGQNNVFMHDVDGTPIFQPWSDQTAGREAQRFQDRQGRVQLQDVLRSLREHPDGIFVTYWTANPRSGQREEKLSFVQGLPDLGVFIGTGNYESEATKVQRQLLTMGLSAGILLLGLISFPLALSLRDYRERSQSLEREVRERLKAETALRRSEATLKAVLDSAPIGIATLKERRYIDVNEAFARIFQRDRSEFLGQSTRMCYDSDEAYEEAGRVLYQEPHGGMDLQAYKALRTDGSSIPVLLRVAPLELEGSEGGHVIIALDITERQRAEEALRLNQERFRIIFDASPLSIALLDPATLTYIDVNAHCCEVLGLDKREVIGRTSRELGLDLDEGKWQEAFQILQRGGTANAMDMRLTLPGSGRRDALVTIRPIPVEGRSLLLVMAMDITDWRRSERAIRESERQYRTLFEGSPIGIFRTTPDGRLQQANPALAAMFRYADTASMVAEVNIKGIGATMYETPEHRADLMRRLGERTGTWFVEEIHFQRRDGSFLDGIMSIIQYEDPETGNPSLFGFVQDLSERKRDENELRTKTALLEAQTNATLDGILVVSEDQKRVLTNKRMLDMFQVPGSVLETEDDAPLLEHVIGMTKDPRRFLKKVRYLYSHPTATSRDEIEFKNGMVLERYSAPVRGERDEVYGRIWIFHDISERRRSELQILHLKNYFANVIDAMPSAVVGLDCSGRVTGWNHAAEVVLGATATEAQGRPIEEVAQEFAPWIAILREEVQLKHRPASRERLLFERNGMRNFYELMLYPVVIEDMEGSVVHILDVTERVRIQELLLQTEKMISLGGLAAGMAHEINNPLGIISQALQNVERRLAPELPANRAVAEETGVDLQRLQAYFERRQVSRFTDHIREAVDRAARIVSNMLLFSRQGSIRQPASLTELVEKALELAGNDYDLKKQHDMRNIEIQREFEPGLPPVKVVAMEIEQVLLNLLKNAAQAMAANPPERRPRMVLRVHQDGADVVMEVEDNGPGMDESVQRRVFEPFFTTKGPGSGTGLGLSVSYTIVTQNHKGLMEVASIPGRGSRFTVRLPALQEPRDA